MTFRPSLGPEHVYAFGLDHPHATEEHAGSVSDILALRSMAEGEHAVVVTQAEALLRAIPPPEEVLEHFHTLQVGVLEEPSALVSRLQALGYERKEYVEARGDIAQRGGILDVFSFGGEVPVRLEFSEDTIESIREFDPISQRSIRQLSSRAHRRESALLS